MLDARERLLEKVDEQVIDRLKTRKDEIDRRFPTSRSSFSTSRGRSFPTRAFMPTMSAASTIAAKPTRPNGRSPTKKAGSSSAFKKARWRRMWSTGQRNAVSMRPHACASTLPPIAGGRLADVEDLRGKAGWARIAKLHIKTPAVTREQLVISVVADDGSTVHPETVERLFRVPAQNEPRRRRRRPQPTCNAARPSGRKTCSTRPKSRTPNGSMSKAKISTTTPKTWNAPSRPKSRPSKRR